jgi:ribosomal protein S21
MLVYANMSLNVSINKNQSESPSSVLRRFTKKMQERGGLNKSRSKRYAERSLSYFKMKKEALKKIKNNNTRLADIKMGKYFNQTTIGKKK